MSKEKNNYGCLISLVALALVVGAWSLLFESRVLIDKSAKPEFFTSFMAGIFVLFVIGYIIHKASK